MGTHATGTVFYGYDLGDMTDRETYESTAPAWLVPDVDDEDASEREWEDELATRLGWVEAPFPAHLFPSSGRFSSSDIDRDHADYRAWSAARDEQRRLVDSVGVELHTYGYLLGGVETTWYVAIGGTRKSATYECLRLDDLTVQPDWNDRLQRFMELLELPVPDSEPGWLVTSSYG